MRDGGECLVMRDIYNDRPARRTDRLGGEIHRLPVELGFKHFVLAGHEMCGEILVFAAVQLRDGRSRELVFVVVDELPVRTEDEHRAGLADLDLVKEVHHLGERDIHTDDGDEFLALPHRSAERHGNARAADR